MGIDGSVIQFAKITALENILSRRGFDQARLKQELATGDDATFGGADSFQQGGGARPVGAPQPARGVPNFPTSGGPAEYDLTPPKLELGPSKAQDERDELEMLREQSKQLKAEKAATELLRSQRSASGPQSGGSATPVATDLGAVMDRQTELLAKILERNSQPKLASTIKVEPRVQWPK